MQPFKALLVALVLGGSAAASAADHSQSSTVEPTPEPTAFAAQGWPAIREVENAWPQWMGNLTGTVLVLQDQNLQPGACNEQSCAQLSGWTRTAPAAHSDTHQQAAQQPYGSLQVRPAGLPWHAELDPQMPRRLSF